MSTLDALVDACEQAVADMEGEELADATPAERQLYERLTLRLMRAMERACMTQGQMHFVVDEFLAAARELAMDVNACAESSDIDIGPAYYVPEPEPPPPELVWIDVTCAACRRDLGRTLIPESTRALVEPTKCPGCIREGR